MTNMRLLFEKSGRAKYISHLDLMRTFQRAFQRAGVRLRHTEGFNPHPYLSFALPLSVGMESLCELMDFDLAEGDAPDGLPERLNSKMPEGIRALEAYVPAAKFSGIARVAVEGRFFYDDGMPEGTPALLESLFGEKVITVVKKSKKGPVETDIAPGLFEFGVSPAGAEELTVRAVLSAQNPTLNPELLVTAVRTHRPSAAPDFAAFRRLELYDAKNAVFR